MRAPHAEVLAIGDELLYGSCIDTNSAWLARELAALGLRVDRLTVTSDDPGHLEGALSDLCRRADVVVLTGGLGPTEDDRTRHAVARVAGTELAFHAESWAWMAEWFAARGRPLRDDNRRQALLPAEAEALRNHWGTAPGFTVTIGGCRLYALPGVPSEMRAMFAQHVVPRLRAAFDAALRPTAHRTLRVLGPTEAALGARLEDVMRPGSAVDVGITAHFGLLTVRIAARADDPAGAERAADAMVERLRPRLADDLLYEGDAPLPAEVLACAAQRSVTLATAESCTGGLLASRLTDVAGASRCYLGGFVPYSNAAKVRDLGVDPDVIERHGAVSAEVAAALADGAAERTQADVAVAITGIAGPGGGTPDKPAGTVWFALRTRETTRTWRRRIPAVNREFVRERSVFEALAAVLRLLRDGALPA